MKPYLRTISPEEALRILFEAFRPWIFAREELLETTEALGRVTAQAVFAQRSVPHYNGAAMDGVALRAQKTYGASEANPIRLKLGQDAFWVDTGDPLPEGTDAVVPTEEVHQEGEWIELIRAAYPWQHVRIAGEDIVKGEMLLPSNHRLRPEDLALLVAAGVRTVRVKARPRVIFIPTGDELRDPFGELLPGEIPEFNSVLIGSSVRALGGDFKRIGPLEDNPSRLKRALEEASGEADLILINAGSSAGREDYAPKVLQEGGGLLFHGLSVMPGRPTFGGAYRGKPVLGLPGYPLSALLAFRLLAEPFLLAMMGQLPSPPPSAKAILAEDVPSRLGLWEFVRVRLFSDGHNLIAHPLPRGAAVLSSVVRAEGILKIPPQVEGFPEGKQIEVKLLVRPESVRRTLLIVGSHDIALDLIADRLRRIYPPVMLATKTAGSLGGLRALARGFCQMATCHLLDPESGTYNIPYVVKYLRGRDVVIIRLFWRQQGIMVQKGNPKAIKGVEDLLRPEVTFVNRQRGGGTRVLLDHLLKQRGLDPGGIIGYNDELTTHMAVAMAIKGGRADAGMGILAAAKALDLDFVPVAEEPYDLVVDRKALEDPMVRTFLELLRDTDLRGEIESLGGYNTAEMGKVIWP
ncbi:MAG: molybdopterin biosynthesis protein [Deltaproteobacteria bacterium]|nr:MAG: molybdopterin biosynthesis protein [Deltaproteobacteria bacterium]